MIYRQKSRKHILITLKWFNSYRLVLKKMKYYKLQASQPKNNNKFHTSCVLQKICKQTQSCIKKGIILFFLI